MDKDILKKFFLLSEKAKKELRKFFKNKENLLILAFCLIFLSYFFSWLKVQMFGYNYGFSGFDLTLGSSRSLFAFKSAFGVDLKNLFFFLIFVPLLGMAGFVVIWAKRKNFLNEKITIILTFILGILDFLIVVWNYLAVKNAEKKVFANLGGLMFKEEPFLGIGFGSFWPFLGGIILLTVSAKYIFENFFKK